MAKILAFSALLAAPMATHAIQYPDQKYYLGGQPGDANVVEIVPDVPEWPFVYETYIPPKLPQSDFNSWMTDKDTQFAADKNGFTNQLYYCNPMQHPECTDTTCFRGTASCPGMSAYFAYNYFSTSTFQAYNCSAKGLRQPAGHFQNTDATLGDIKLCDTSKGCCHEQYNAPIYTNMPTVHKLQTDRMKNGGCTMIDEPNYCVQMYGGYSAWLCSDYWTDPRPFINPCPDVMVRYYNSCSSFSKVGYRQVWESQQYNNKAFYDTLTPEQINFVAALMLQTDRVCRPYSYYYPEDDGTGKDAYGIGKAKRKAYEKQMARTEESKYQAPAPATPAATPDTPATPAASTPKASPTAKATTQAPKAPGPSAAAPAASAAAPAAFAGHVAACVLAAIACLMAL